MSAPRESQAEAIQRRLVVFSGRLLRLAARLPQNFQARHVGKQLTRSGTALAANYGEVRGAESRSDFIHKLRIVLKELNETEVWLSLIVESSWFPADKISPIIAENRELCRIFAASIRTAGGFSR
jgi:four helix bundle protein